MSIKLPNIIAAYVQAQNAHDAKAMLACFSESAVVHDEGEKHSGKKAIGEWIDKTTKKYKPHFSPTKIEEGDKETVLTAEVSGSFEGSPVDLDFHFVIENENQSGRLRALGLPDFYDLTIFVDLLSKSDAITHYPFLVSCYSERLRKAIKPNRQETRSTPRSSAPDRIPKPAGPSERVRGNPQGRARIRGAAMTRDS